MLYQKISGPFKRDMSTNLVMRDVWTSDALEALADVPIWTATEKIDGTNMRVLWDGYTVTFGGRTDRAELHGDLIDTMTAMFPQEKFEQTFGTSEVVIFGEGYGGKIQSGGKYCADKSFAMFDIAVNETYLRPGDTLDLARGWGIEHVPTRFDLMGESTLTELIEYVSNGIASSYGAFTAEGLVAKTSLGLLDRRGNRLIVKLKGCDLNVAD